MSNNQIWTKSLEKEQYQVKHVKQPNMNKVSQEGDEIPSQTCQTTKYEGEMHALPGYLSLPMSDLPKKEETLCATF